MMTSSLSFLGKVFMGISTEKWHQSLRILVFSRYTIQEVSYVYSLGDVSIVPCKKGFGGSAMPSKTWSIMATGTPVLASYDSGTDLERLILSEQVGLFSEADDVESLVKSILELYSSPERKDKMGFNARNYVLTNMSREICTRKYIEVIRRTVSEFR